MKVYTAQVPWQVPGVETLQMQPVQLVPLGDKECWAVAVLPMGYRHRHGEPGELQVADIEGGEVCGSQELMDPASRSSGSITLTLGYVRMSEGVWATVQNVWCFRDQNNDPLKGMSACKALWAKQKQTNKNKHWVMHCGANVTRTNECPMRRWERLEP